MTTPPDPEQMSEDIFNQVTKREREPSSTTLDNAQPDIQPSLLPPHPDFLAGGGEMGERIRAKDWAKTPLGPVEQWPQSLKTVVRIMLTTHSNWCVWNHTVYSLSVRT